MSRRTLGRRARTLAMAVAVVVLWAPTDRVEASEGVVAVGDVHGSFDGLTTILRETGLIDDQNRWTGGSTVFVQTGDLLDRGVKLQEVIGLLMRLQEEAPKSGGQVHVLLGNHETMNLLGITRDVNRGAFAEFATDQSEARRSKGWAMFKAFWRRRMPEIGQQPVFSKEAKAQWMAVHPPGFFEYVEAFGPDGTYGRWMRQLPGALVIGDSLFIHGGYGPSLKGVSVEEINTRVVVELATFDETRAWMVAEGLALPWYSVHELTREAERELRYIAGQDPDSLPPERIERAKRLSLDWSSWSLLHPEGPFWFRGTAKWNEGDHLALMTALLDDLGVKRQVVGHTPQATGRIQARFDNRVFLIDTGMLASVYRGVPSALEIIDDTIVAVYPGERQILVRGPPADPSSTAGP